jgi:hypothetical protein
MEGAGEAPVAVATKWSANLIFAEFSDEPQSAERIHAALVEKYGAEAVPAIRSVQSALSTRGERMGGAKIYKGRQVLWVRAAEGAVPPASSRGGGGKKRRLSKTASKKLAEQAKRERAADSRVSLKSRAEELLAQPLTAFMIFGFSQRGIMKRHKSSAAVREAVKAVGERWLLLSDADRAKYEAMAVEDRERARLAAEYQARLAAEAQAADEAGAARAGDAEDGAEDEGEGASDEGDEDAIPAAPTGA